jgi:hypothetical protein
MAQSNLPPCVGELTRWDRCYGTYRAHYIELTGFVGKYSGEWVQGKPYGQGVLIMPNQQGYVEASELPKNYGINTKFVSDGGRYIGDFKNGLYDGLGIEYSGSGAVERSGVYERGRFVFPRSVSLGIFGRLKYEPALKWVTFRSETDDALRMQKKAEPQLAETCKTLFLIFLDGLKKCLSDADYRKVSAGYGELSVAITNYERGRPFALYSTKPVTLETTGNYFGNQPFWWGWGRGTQSQFLALKECESQIKKRLQVSDGLECRLLFSSLDGSPGALNVALSSQDFVRVWPLAITGLYDQTATSTADTADAQQVASTEEYTPPLTLIEKERLALEAEQSDRARGDKVGIGQKTNQEEIYRLRAEAEEAKRKQAELEAQLAAAQQSKVKPTLSVNTEGKRVALVIGNAKYKFNPLNNPVNDATDMAASLRSVGFDVIEVKDATLKQMREATRRFADKLEVSDVGLVYYSGHGIEVKGKNYLIPVNADIRREYEVVDQAFDASNLLRMMESLQSGTKKRVNILIVDACRNNDLPKSWRSTNSGLARMDAPAGSFISFATAPGQVASDGQGRNSPYTKHLLNALKQPNVPIEQVFKQVRRNVMDETGGEQVPWENSSLIGDFYFTVKR